MQSKRRDRDPLSERSPASRRWVVQGYMLFRPNTQFTPPTDVIELEDRLIVLIEIAGMRPADFSVNLSSRSLTIAGTRERPPFQGGAYHQVEIGYGEFRVEIVLPWEAEPDDVTAGYRDGFLQVELPRKVEQRIRVIDVHVEEEGTDSNE